jgi:lysozyme family protein
MTVFAPAFEYLMSSEDPGLKGKVTSDSGGTTKYGISQKSYPHLDIPNLTLEDAAAIYRRDYFEPIHGFEIEKQSVASKLLDMAVNMGVETAIRICQECVSVTVDGVMGPRTLGAINAAIDITLLKALAFASSKHYREIAAAKPDEAKYLVGWLKRAGALPQ